MNKIASYLIDDILSRDDWHDKEKILETLLLFKSGRKNLSNEQRIKYLRYNNVYENSFSRKRTRIDEDGDL